MIPLLKVHMPPTVGTAIAPVLESGYVADGAQVKQFEELLGAHLGNPQVTATSDMSGTLMLALYAAGVRPDDEVIVSPMSCTATTMPIANLFAQPVWCDVDPLTGMLDPDRIVELISPKTKAILVLHWSGDVAPIDRIVAIAKQHGLAVIEDASEAFGAEYQGKPLGNHGPDFTVYSFQAVRHISTGEGAALVCRDAAAFAQVKRLKRYGIDRTTFRLPNGDFNAASDIPVAGFNVYMNNIAAAIGIDQFRYVKKLIARYRDNGAFYELALQNVPGVRLLHRLRDSCPSYWTYTLLVEERDRLVSKLLERGIGTQRLHIRNDIYSCFGPAVRSLPGVDAFDRSTLSIPCGWWVSDADREFIVASIRSGW